VTEVEVPFGRVVVAAGHSPAQESWVGVDDVAEFEFALEPR
jgi:hypothetical protein